MPSKTEACNMALSNLCVGVSLTDVDTDDSEAAAACRVFFEPVLKRLLRSKAWPFATKSAQLDLVEEDPTTEWSYSYSYPSDCVMFRRILGATSESSRSRLTYRIVNSTAGRLIYTNESVPVGEYTRYFEDFEHYPDDFVLAFAWLLASYIAGRVTREPEAMRKQAMEMFRFELGVAVANSFNEEQPQVEPEAEWIEGR